MMKLLGVSALVALAACGAQAVATDDPDTNQVSYWCPDGGEKYEVNADEFTVPAPPTGKMWTLLVLKAGSEQSVEVVNEQIPNPVVGQTYTRTDGKSISHVILCYTPAPVPTTGPPVTTTPVTTAPPTTAPPTTAPPTTAPPTTATPPPPGDDDNGTTMTTAPRPAPAPAPAPAPVPAEALPETL